MRLYGREQFTKEDIFALSTEPYVHRDFRDHLFDIYDEVSRALHVPARAVMLTGSAFTGRSFAKGRPFAVGESDLDLAVIDRDLFRELLLCSARATKYFRDQTSFLPHGSRPASEVYKSFRSYAFNRGIVRPDLMPDCDARNNLLNVSSDLSNKYIAIFSKISISVYGDEEYFIAKIKNPGAV